MITVLFFLIVPQFYDNSQAEFTYTLLEDGTITIDGYTGSPKKLEVPSEIDGHSVSALSESAFANKQTLEKVILPESLIEIGDDAFYNCTGLREVEALGVKKIGYASFYGCYYLKKITWSAEIEHIGDSAFASCTRLKSLKIPESCAYIGTDAFMACESLVLDCSENEAAAAVAAQYGIATGFAETDDWVFLQAGLLTLAAVALLIFVWQIVKRKKNKKMR